MRKLQTIVIIVLVALLLAIWAPWNSFNFSLLNLLGITLPDQVSGIQLISLAGELEVFIDETSQGTAKSDSPLIVPGIKPGQHQVRVVRKSNTADAYWQLNKLIQFVPNTETIIALELGPTEYFSEGHIIYAQPRNDEDAKVELYVRSEVAGTTAELEGLNISSALNGGVELDISKQHKLKISKQGYETQEFTLLPDNQEARDKFKGYDLIVEVILFLQPI